MGGSTWGVPPPTPPGKFEGRTHKVDALGIIHHFYIFSKI